MQRKSGLQITAGRRRRRKSTAGAAQVAVDLGKRRCLSACQVPSVVSDSLRPHAPQPARLLCPWDSPGKNNGVSSHSLLQGIFPTQGSNPRLLHCRHILSRLSHMEARRMQSFGYKISKFRGSMAASACSQRWGCWLCEHRGLDTVNKVAVNTHGNEPEYSLEGLVVKLKLQYSAHLMQRTDSLEKPLMLGKIEGRRRRGGQRMRWLGGITNSME